MSIIGISGKIGSGKDTVGKIIQLLTSEMPQQREVISWNDDDNLKEVIEKSHNHSTWQIKKFAYAVKQVVSILTGIPIEDFEKQEVKDRVLGEEWNYLDTGGDEGRQVVPLLVNTFQKQHIFTITVRELLQQVGTDAMRNVIHPNVWVNALMSQYSAINLDLRQSMGNVIDYSRCFPNWLITDVRFHNEAQSIKARDGIIIRINRRQFKTIQMGDIAVTMLQSSVGQHPSETELDNYPFDYAIDNNGTIEELVDKVRELLKRINYHDK